MCHSKAPNSKGSGHAVQILKITDNHKYELNKKALADVLLADDVANLPVVVVSVAGAMRGGKSFILNFFLRYLHYKYVEGNEDDNWLGSDYEPLQGFEWRGGDDRNTSGILLWSKPIRVELPNGQKAVVLLMDTQGSFDDESTVKDNSTIFGLSMLTSSTQVYNVSQNIREDTLQHLQLFTQYGKLAAAQQKRPFQKLMFLVRDWSYAYKHPFGIEGGKQVLKKKLEPRSTQAEELRNVRLDISNSFDDVSCFLMPYPGEKVAEEENFNGNLNDMKENFKNAIKELVPLLFAPANLTPRLVNGLKITASELFDYIKIYVKEFGSGKLPTPMSLFKATAEVALQRASSEAVNTFTVIMDNACDDTSSCFTPAGLRQVFATAKQAAYDQLAQVIAQFTVPDDSDDEDADGQQHPRLAELTAKIDQDLPHYELINESKIKKTFEKAKKVYSDSLLQVSEVEKFCLHPEDLRNLHNDSVLAAIKVFNSNRSGDVDDHDEQSEILQTELDNRFSQLRAVNELNNNAAVAKARNQYMQTMAQICSQESCLTSEALKEKHDETMDRAIGTFKSARTFYKHFPDDDYMSSLTQSITENFEKFQENNNKQNQSAVKTALNSYESSMKGVCHPTLPCLHPEDLFEEHEEVKQRVINDFFSNRRGRDSAADENIQTVKQGIEERYRDLVKLNEANNNWAVRSARSVYEVAMEAASGEGRPQLKSKHFAAAHDASAKYAERAFDDRRRTSSREHESDIYREKLLKDIDDMLPHYRRLNETNPKIPYRNEQELLNLNPMLSEHPLFRACTIL